MTLLLLTDNFGDLVLWEIGSGDCSWGVCLGWMRRREKLGKASGGLGSVCVVVGGFKISCSWVGSHVAQRRPSKEKKKLSLESIYCLLLHRYRPNGSCQHCGGTCNHDEQINSLSPHGSLFQISTRLQLAQMLLV